MLKRKVSKIFFSSLLFKIVWILIDLSSRLVIFFFEIDSNLSSSYLLLLSSKFIYRSRLLLTLRSNFWCQRQQLRPHAYFYYRNVSVRSRNKLRYIYIIKKKKTTLNWGCYLTFLIFLLSVLLGAISAQNDVGLGTWLIYLFI